MASTSRSYSNPKKSLVKYGRLDEDPSSFQLGKVGFLVVAVDVDVVTTRCHTRSSSSFSSSSSSSSSSFSSLRLSSSMIFEAMLSLSKVMSCNAFKTVDGGGCPSASFLGDFLVVLTGDPSNTYVSLLRLLTASFNSSSAAIFATTAFQRSNSGTTFELFNVSYKLSNSFSFPRFSASSSKRRLELSETPLVTENSDTMFANTAADVSAYRFFLLLLLKPSTSKEESPFSSSSSKFAMPKAAHISSTCGWMRDFARVFSSSLNTASSSSSSSDMVATFVFCRPLAALGPRFCRGQLCLLCDF